MSQEDSVLNGRSQAGRTTPAIPLLRGPQRHQIHRERQQAVGTGGGDGERVSQGTGCQFGRMGGLEKAAVMLGSNGHVLTVPELRTQFRKVNSVSRVFHHDCKAGRGAQPPLGPDPPRLSWKGTVGSCCLSGRWTVDSVRESRPPCPWLGVGWGWGGHSKRDTRRGVGGSESSPQLPAPSTQAESFPCFSFPDMTLNKCNCDL